MKPILSPDLADASPMLETYADSVKVSLLERVWIHALIVVMWSEQHDGFIVVVQSEEWESPRYVQTTDWMVTR